ncbi:MAG: hypothetical protein K2P81_08690 [Bacteriovoracaceae bacterium]|nr:hypothetical protein [Bacteriovoracaceae bacterium]
MRLLIAFVAFFISIQAFSCDRVEAEKIVKEFIANDFNQIEKVRTLKLGTILKNEFTSEEQVTIVHAVVEVEKHGRKVSEQAIVFKFNEFCHVDESHGAVLYKVPFN